MLENRIDDSFEISGAVEEEHPQREVAISVGQHGGNRSQIASGLYLYSRSTVQMGD